MTIVLVEGRPGWSRPRIPGLPSSLCSVSATSNRESHPVSTTRTRALTARRCSILPAGAGPGGWDSRTWRSAGNRRQAGVRVAACRGVSRRRPEAVCPAASRLARDRGQRGRTNVARCPVASPTRPAARSRNPQPWRRASIRAPTLSPIASAWSAAGRRESGARHHNCC